MRPQWMHGVFLSILKKRFRREAFDSPNRKTRKLQWEYMLCLLNPKCGPHHVQALSINDMKEVRDFLRILLKEAIAVHRQVSSKQGMGEAEFQRIMSFCEEFYEMTRMLLAHHRKIPSDMYEEDRIFKSLADFLSKYYWI